MTGGGISEAGEAAATEDLIVPTRARYAGRVELGEDLMVIDVGQTVTVQRLVRSAPARCGPSGNRCVIAGMNIVPGVLKVPA